MCSFTIPDTFGVVLSPGSSQWMLHFGCIFSGAWSGPTAVIYRSFDTLDNLTFMEGNAEGNFAALVPRKVRSRFFFDRMQLYLSICICIPFYLEFPELHTFYATNLLFSVVIGEYVFALQNDELISKVWF